MPRDDNRTGKQLWDLLSGLTNAYSMAVSFGLSGALSIIVKGVTGLPIGWMIALSGCLFFVFYPLFPRGTATRLGKWRAARRNEGALLRNPELRPPQPQSNQYALFCETPNPWDLKVTVICSESNVIPYADNARLDCPNGTQTRLERSGAYEARTGMRELGVPEGHDLEIGSYKISLLFGYHPAGTTVERVSTLAAREFTIEADGQIRGGWAGWRPSMELIGGKAEFSIEGRGESISGFRCQVAALGIHLADDRILGNRVMKADQLPERKSTGSFMFPSDFQPKSNYRRLPVDVNFVDYDIQECQVTWHGWSRTPEGRIDLVFLGRQRIRLRDRQLVVE